MSALDELKNKDGEWTSLEWVIVHFPGSTLDNYPGQMAKQAAAELKRLHTIEAAARELNDAIHGEEKCPWCGDVMAENHDPECPVAKLAKVCRGEK